MESRSVLRRAALDLAAWLVPAALFLSFYVVSSYASIDAVLSHLHFVVLVWSCVALVRLALARLASPRTAVAVSALLVGTSLSVLLVYYSVVLIGLQSWGRVISWDLIRSYAIQAPALADALGLSIHAVAAVLLAFYLLVFAAAWACIRRFDWAGPAARAATTPVVALVIASGALSCAAGFYSFFAYPPLQKREPVSLTFYPFDSAIVLQNAAIDAMRAERLDRLDNAARGSYRPNPAAIRRNVFLIVVDALRSDRMGVYGYSRDTTPNLDRLAGAGMIRKPAQARAACSASACGLLSLVTSKFVHEFSTKPFSLYEVLKLHGYRIRMILGGDHANFYGLKELFGPVDEYYDGSLRREMYMNDDRGVLAKAAELPKWDGVPVMMQFHLMSSHVLGQRQPEFARFAPWGSYALPGNRRSPLAGNFYDNGVVQADAVIHELLQTLRGRGYLEDALVVVTADHGESLGEGGRYSHAQSVADEALRIPLLLIAHGYRPREPWRDGIIASQVDVAPTILAELGMPRPQTWSGFALQEPFSRLYTYFQEAYAAGLVDQRDPNQLWKYWVDSRNVREYAFDLSADPQETVNVIDTVTEPLKRAWRLQYLRFQPGGTGRDTLKFGGS